MSKIDELIEGLCPEGVEFRRLGEIGTFYGGLSGKSKSDFEDGNAKFITYRNVYNNPALELDVEDKVKIGSNERQNTLRYGDVIFTGSSETPDECGLSSVVTTRTDEKLYLNSFCFFLRFNEGIDILPDFSKHLFRSNDLRYQICKTASGVTRFNVSKKLMEKVLIPLPPLAVQEEIVRILDAFTSLEAELEAELEARKKQYAYYRDTLLSFDRDDSNVEWKRLGEVCEMKAGKHIPSSKIKAIQSSQYPYPCYGGNGLRGYVCEYNQDGVKSLIGRQGALCGNVCFVIGKFYATEHAVVVTDKGHYEDRFLFHYLTYMDINKYKSAGAQPGLAVQKIETIPIPIPPLSVQHRIAETLDKFEALTSDLQSGLPAEIEARRKQYEYYRDRLLSFKVK